MNHKKTNWISLSRYKVSIICYFVATLFFQNAFDPPRSDMVLFFVFYIFIKILKWESEINKPTHRMSVSDRKSLWDPLIHVITVYKKVEEN